MTPSSPRFKGKIAVVTGGASGIGAAIARLLIAEGAQVVLGDLDDVKAQALVAELGADHATYARCDVSVQPQVEALIETAVQRWGGLDLLFNNAGTTGASGAAPDVDPNDWLKVVGVNLNAVFYGCRAAIPALRARGGGAIVNTASISGLAGDFGFNAYNATKAAVINYTRTLALDHARENIRVNAFCPGMIDTPLSAPIDLIGLRAQWLESIPMGRAGRPEEMAEVAAFLASDAASYMTGSIVVADGGTTAHTGQPNLPAAIKRLSAGAP